MRAIVICCIFGYLYYNRFAWSVSAMNGSPKPFGLEEIEVATNLPDNTHWIVTEDFDKDGKPDIISVSIAEGWNYFHRNTFPEHSTFERLPLLSDSTAKGIIHMAPYDVNQDGYQDLIIAYNWKNCFMECTDDAGSIGWLENPGNEEGWKREWRLRNVVKNAGTGIHRVKMVLAADGSTVLIGSAIVGANAQYSLQFKDKTAPQIVYRRPSLQKLQEWKDAGTDDDWEVVTKHDQFHTLHELFLEEQNSAEDRITATTMVTAGYEGVHRVNILDGSVTTLIPAALRPDFHSRPGWISSLAHVQQPIIPTTGPTPIDFFATIEPLHGDELVVYFPDSSAPNGWRRQLVERRKFRNKKVGKNMIWQHGGHDVLVADVDCDGHPELLALFRGSESQQGMGFVIYKPDAPLSSSFSYSSNNNINFQPTIKFQPTMISASSFNTFNVADYDGDGINDFAVVGWGTAKKDHRIVVYLSKSEKCFPSGGLQLKNQSNRRKPYTRNL